MSKYFSKNGIKATLLMISLCQLGSLALSSVISNILDAFPSVSDQTAQFLMTFPGLFILFTSLLSAALTKIISQKKLAIIGLILNAVPAIGGFFFHGNIILLFFWAAALGLGLGLWMPLVSAMASRFFEGAERASLLGKISSAQNIGAILMTVIGGALAVISWYYVYLVYYIAVPGLICSVIFLPDEKVQKDPNTLNKSKKSLKELGIDGSVLLFGIMQLLFSLPYNAGPSNFSLIVSENGLGNSGTAGILSGLFLFGGIISGWFFGALDKKIKKMTIPVGFLLLAISFVGLGTVKNLVLIMLFTVIGGMSLPLTLPQASLGVIENKRPEQFAMAMAVLMALGNLGAFLSPITTSLAVTFTGSDSIDARMLFCASFALICAVIFSFIFKFRKEK